MAMAKHADYQHHACVGKPVQPIFEVHFPTRLYVCFMMIAGAYDGRGVLRDPLGFRHELSGSYH